MCGVTSENGQGCMHRDNVIYSLLYRWIHCCEQIPELAINTTFCWIMELIASHSMHLLMYNNMPHLDVTRSICRENARPENARPTFPATGHVNSWLFRVQFGQKWVWLSTFTFMSRRQYPVCSDMTSFTDPPPPPCLVTSTHNIKRLPGAILWCPTCLFI